MNKGKNKRRQLTCFDDVHDLILSVDSQEEIDTCAWLCEACSLSVINDFMYQPPSYQLFDSVKYVDVDGKEKTLFRDHLYTPDWMLTFNPSVQKTLAKEFKTSYDCLSCADCSVFIDSKGTFNAQERSFSYNQKWTWQKFKIYIYKLVPKAFFKKFGVPQASINTSKTKKPRKMFQGFSLLKDLFNSFK